MGRKEDEKIAPHCDFIHVHEQVVKQVMDVMPQGDELQQLAEFFRVFGDSTRIRILYALSQSELCVCDIASLLNMGHKDHTIGCIRSKAHFMGHYDHGDPFFCNIFDNF